MASESGDTVPIRAVCAMYGVNPATLRTWERRYNVVEPVRGEGGQRGYSQDDLDAVREMVELRRRGVGPCAAAQKVRSRRKAGGPGERRCKAWNQRFQNAVREMRSGAVLEVCRAAERALGYQHAVEEVLFPQLACIGEQSHSTAGAVAEEHLVTLGIRTWLSDRYLLPDGGNQNVPIVTLACVPVEMHDLPLLHLANLLAETRRVRPSVLAGGLPLAETLVCAERTGSHLLLLSATMPVPSAELRVWAQEIRQAGWERKCVLAGGAFRNSRIFSETRLRPAMGNYGQAAALILDLVTPQLRHPERIASVSG